MARQPPNTPTQHAIMDTLTVDGPAQVRDLATWFQVSETTIRRRLDGMVTQNLVVMSYVRGRQVYSVRY